jgi:hypothetical protein
MRTYPKICDYYCIFFDPSSNSFPTAGKSARSKEGGQSPCPDASGKGFRVGLNEGSRDKTM